MMVSLVVVGRIFWLSQFEPGEIFVWRENCKMMMVPAVFCTSSSGQLSLFTFGEFAKQHLFIAWRQWGFNDVNFSR